MINAQLDTNSRRRFLVERCSQLLVMPVSHFQIGSEVAVARSLYEQSPTYEINTGTYHDRTSTLTRMSDHP
jgi:hypothetical protein